MKEEMVVLVDEKDRETGLAPKLEAHMRGLLHRAVSLILRDRHGRVLLQRRAEGKYHSGGLWSNTCCGHPRPGESLEDAAKRRLQDEMGIGDCPLRDVGSFIYRAELEGGLIEHEIDHVMVGEWNGEPVPDQSEVSEWRWINESALSAELAAKPRAFTAWFGQVLSRARGR